MVEARVQRIIDPKNWVDRQITTLKAVGEDNYAKGISMPKKDPIAAGIAAEGKYKDKMKKVLEDGSRAKGLEKTDMSEWYNYSQTIGKGRIVEGVVLREAKVNDFVTKFQPLLTDHVAKVDALKDVSDKDREDRMLENLRGLRALHGKA